MRLGLPWRAGIVTGSSGLALTTSRGGALSSVAAWAGVGWAWDLHPGIWPPRPPWLVSLMNLPFLNSSWPASARMQYLLLETIPITCPCVSHSFEMASCTTTRSPGLKGWLVSFGPFSLTFSAFASLFSMCLASCTSEIRLYY